MRLKTLELQGFKSFPDKTKITIDRGMTVVVGPNGSGKSNVSDAIRFVLGEISSKNIRGNKMEDLIFDGTERRRPMGFARVSLTFDNTEGEIPLPLDYDEVTVTRQLFRSGGSEYYINGKPVRLKDIRDLFMNTGLGKSGYSIIGQGRVDEIISEKSEDRRGIFEEAAGIAKYRVRKTEAEKKLAETEDNLSRVSDILSELEGRVEPLQKEAEKAKKYLSLYEEKKKADVGLWLYEIDGILSESEKLREDYEIAKHSLEMTDDSLNALSGRNEKLSESLHESRRNEEEAERLLNEHTERLHETESSEKLFLRDIAHLQEEMERLRRERAQKKEEEKKAENALAECEARRREAISCAESVESALHDAEGRLEEKRTALRLLGERLEELRGEAAALGEQILQKQLALSSLEGRDNSDEGRREELTAELAEISRRISATKEALREGEDTAAAYTERADGLRKKEDALLVEEEAIGEKVSACKAAIEKESSAKSGNFSRMEALRRMEEHFEGYANSVRFVMDMAEKGRLRGIRGPVSRLLSVDARYTVAIETALGGNLQNILVEDEAAAKAAIRCLAEHKAGRTTFYPLAVMRPERLFADPAKLSRMRGYVGIASELCRFDEHDRPVMEYLLCRTVVCEDLDSAGEIARSFGYKFRIVTLDGQIINAGGSFTGGSAKRDSGMLSRRAEIERLQREIKRSEDTVGEKKKALMQLEKDAEALRGKREQLESEREILGVMRGAEDAEQKVRKATLLGDEEQLARTKEALAALNEKSENRTRSMEAARAALAALQAEEEKQKALLSEENERLLSGQTALTALVEEKNALLLKKTVSVRDREFAERELSAANEALAAAITGGKSFEEAIAKAESREQSVKTTVESTRGELSALRGQIDSDRETCARLKKEAEDAERQLEELREQEKQKQHERDIFFGEYTKLESRMENVEREQDKYTSRLWEEYELSYSAAAALGYPKLTKETKTAAAAAQTRLRGQIKSLGSVNVGAIEEYDEVKGRYDFLSAQYGDLTGARNDLTGVIFRLEKEMRVRFEDTFRAINEHFKTVFTDLFGGGKAELTLSDPENPLESGIEIAAAPPGKIIKSLTQLSGGEQAFIAIALFFAILKVTPAPFCLLDEIESALDEVNVARFADYAKRFSDKTQFIIISHRRGTMEEADVLYGVTMQERGISRLLSMNVGEVEEKLGEKFK